MMQTAKEKLILLIEAAINGKAGTEIVSPDPGKE